jgi:hypothetical protein
VTAASQPERPCQRQMVMRLGKARLRPAARSVPAMPAFVEPVPELVPGGILVQAADLFSARPVSGWTGYEPLRTGAGNTTF